MAFTSNQGDWSIRLEQQPPPPVATPTLDIRHRRGRGTPGVHLLRRVEQADSTLHVSRRPDRSCMPM
jgi:hypothetical protein